MLKFVLNFMLSNVLIDVEVYVEVPVEFDVVEVGDGRRGRAGGMNENRIPDGSIRATAHRHRRGVLG